MSAEALQIVVFASGVRLVRTCDDGKRRQDYREEKQNRPAPRTVKSRSHLAPIQMSYL
jgi:hypothetical protein